MQGVIGQATFFTTEPRGCAAVQPFGGPAVFYDTSKVGRLAAVQSRGLPVDLCWLSFRLCIGGHAR